MPEVAHLVAQYKRSFRDRLVRTAAEAGAADPETLGGHLAVIYEGATALATSCNDRQVITDARSAAAALITTALAASS